MVEIQDRVRGVLLGLAAGDRNGGPIRMAVRLAESLTERRYFDPDDILARYLAWWWEGAFDTGPTTGTMLSLIDGSTMAAEHRGGAVRRGIAPPLGCATRRTRTGVAWAPGGSGRDARLLRCGDRSHPLDDAVGNSTERDRERRRGR